MNTVITLTSKNQLTLPTKLVLLLGLNKGSRFWTRVEKRSIILEAVEDSWDGLHGVLADTPAAKKHTVQEVIEIAKKKEIARVMNDYAK